MIKEQADWVRQKINDPQPKWLYKIAPKTIIYKIIKELKGTNAYIYKPRIK